MSSTNAERNLSVTYDSLRRILCLPASPYRLEEDTDTVTSIPRNRCQSTIETVEAVVGA